MKVLITGGYGFIGSHTAEYFHREGHDIHIIDNLSTGKNIPTVKHKLYEMDVTSDKCEEVFASNLFDVVIHLAAHSDIESSVEEPYTNAEVNVLGVVNMLHLSKKFGVRKFVCASSTGVYGEQDEILVTEDSDCNPNSPYGISKLSAESYCKLFREKHGVETVCLRLSNVYGPRQALNKSGDFVVQMIEQLAKGNNVALIESGKLYNLVYVSDVVDAIYKAVEFSKSSVLNISGSKVLKATHIEMLLKEFDPSLPKIEPMDIGKFGDDWKVDNSKAVTELNWVPLNNLKTGLYKTLMSFAQDMEERRQTQIQEQEKKENVIWKFIKRIVPYLENILVFSIVVFLYAFVQSNRVELTFDLRMAYILILGIHYGLKQSSIAVVLSCIHFVYGIYDAGRDFISLIYNVDTLVHFSMYIFVGALVGYAIDSMSFAVKDKTMEFDELKEKFDFLYELYSESKQVRLELQDQIISSEDSFLKIYNATSRLDTLKPDQIFNEAVRVVEDIMRSNEVSIYLVSGNQHYLRLIAKSRDHNLDLSKSIEISSLEGAVKAIESKDVYINKEFDAHVPMMMVPILINENPVAMVNIHDMQFKSMSLYKQNLLRTLGGLITSALGKAYKYEEARNNIKHVEGTSVLKAEYFYEELDSRLHGHSINETSFSVLKFAEKRWKEEEINDKVLNLIREYDVFGVNEDNQLMLILTNTALKEAEFVINRFKERGFDVDFAFGEDKYDQVINYSRIS